LPTRFVPAALHLLNSGNQLFRDDFGVPRGRFRTLVTEHGLHVRDMYRALAV
jgi:hypothetical protein